jgi:hypothetical protein
MPRAVAGACGGDLACRCAHGFVSADVRSEERVAVHTDAAGKTYGGLDFAFKNAGRGFNSNPGWA